MRHSYPGQHVVIEAVVAIGCHPKGHPGNMTVEGGMQDVSSITVPLEHETPILTSANELTHVVEHDLGGVKGAAVIVAILIKSSEYQACLNTD